MAVDSRQHSQMGGIAFEPLRYPMPQFNNPWAGGSSGAPASSQMYASSHPTPPTLESSSHIQQRPTTISMPYSNLPLTSTALAPGSSLPGGSYPSASAIQTSQDLLSGRNYASQYPTTGSSNSYVPASAAGYPMAGYGFQQDGSRRLSNPLSHTAQVQRNSFSEALDASRGMISLSQSDITPTPRNISASESVDMNHRTLPRPSTLIGNGTLPAPQSMMGQFSSKVSSSSQKKHKCKVCDKRFTRPSSLQTHMYSHTGEKPFACEIEGCGRHFSVVSNLRRHRKVHKDEGEPPSQNEE